MGEPAGGYMEMMDTGLRLLIGHLIALKNGCYGVLSFRNHK